MKRSLAALLLALSVTVPPSTGVAGGIDVDVLTFCEGVAGREPVRAATTFAPDVGEVCCFTRIVGAEDVTSVFHVWIYDNTEMAKVELPVGAVAWRTWSTKRILEAWTGTWRVEVQTADGTILKSSEFVVEKPAG